MKRTITVLPIESEYGAVVMIDKIKNLQKPKNSDNTYIVFIDGSFMEVSESMKTLQAMIESESD